MSEKRFVYGIVQGSRQAHIKDCHTCKSATIDVYDDDFNYFVDLLNNLNAENEQLRQILKDIVVATDETYTKNIYMFKITVLLNYEKYMEIKRCLND